MNNNDNTTNAAASSVQPTQVQELPTKFAPTPHMNDITHPTGSSCRTTMNGKPVLYRENPKSVITIPSVGFHDKLLCDGITFNTGDACAYSCTFCYVGPAMMKVDKKVLEAHREATGEACKFSDVVIRRRGALDVLRKQLVRPNGEPFYDDPNDTRVAYSSTLVDVAANMELLRETAAVCNLILEYTNWQIRLLSKSNLLHKLVEDGMIPEKYFGRLIFGFSTGTLDDKVAAAIERGTARVSKRLESLHWLQDHGFRTFGMICPSLPQENYAIFSREIRDAIRVDRCEHVWAEVINLRGQSLARTLAALDGNGLHREAALLSAVSGPKAKARWEDYARRTFRAHAAFIPADKLRFLQYVDARNADWWAQQRSRGALLLGKYAEAEVLTTLGESAPIYNAAD